MKVAINGSPFPVGPVTVPRKKLEVLLRASVTSPRQASCTSLRLVGVL